MTSKCKAENLPLELNFNLAYDDFKEQDQLRNSALAFKSLYLINK